MKRTGKLLMSLLVGACLIAPPHSEATTQKVKVVKKVYLSSPGYANQNFYANNGSFYQRTWSANFAEPGGLVTEPTDVVKKGAKITVSFKMLSHLVFKNAFNGTLNTAYATVRFAQWDSVDKGNGGALFTAYNYLLTQKTDIGTPQKFGVMDFKTAKTITQTFVAPQTGKYCLFFELKDLTRDGSDTDADGNNAYYGVQNVTYKY